MPFLFLTVVLELIVRGNGISRASTAPTAFQFVFLSCDEIVYERPFLVPNRCCFTFLSEILPLCATYAPVLVINTRHISSTTSARNNKFFFLVPL